MNTLYRLSIDPSYPFEQAWNSLEELGLDILYGSEEQEKVELIVCLDAPEPLEAFAWIMECEPHALPPIDWQSQWEMHAHHFKEGHMHLDLSSFGRFDSALILQPGAGFGDLSHPTTRLMLKMLSEQLQDQIVIDIGCGSGILALSALAMKAPMAYGIDIDPQALEHARQNALLNHFETKSDFSLPSDFTWTVKPQPVLMLMNMIRTEQIEAWSSLSALHPQSGLLITSGVRAEEREIYLHQIAQYGWRSTKEEEEMGWLAFNLRK